MMIFKSLDSIVVKGYQVFFVANPVTCKEFTHILGQSVYIDGKPYQVRGVERFAHGGLHYEGTTIGLMVEPLEDKSNELP